ncbi:MAG: MarR family transcriptional regulator [Phycisphaerales bacterium]|nr:MarR family transcriptional regulator [Phycisphaerales bacterium]
MSAPTIPETPSAVPPDRAFFEVLRTIGLFRRVMEPYFARHGISQAQWGVLINLHCAAKNGDGSMRLADLVEKLLVRPPSVTHVVERLRVAGLIVRECSATDHRAKVVRLTVAGRELVERVLKQHGRQIALVLAGLDGEEQTQLRGLLGKLNSHLESVAPHDVIAEGSAFADGAAGESED